MRFTKMHGIGNDYLYLDLWRDTLPANVAALAPKASDRHFGVGSDGIIAVGPSKVPGAHARMQMWNSDGSQSEMCGNGLRCSARLAFDRGHIPAKAVIETGAGLLATEIILDAKGAFYGVRIDMGLPRLTPAEVPVDLKNAGPMLTFDLPLPGGEKLALQCVGMGNPHAVHFCPDAEAFPLDRIGPQVERHPLFPRRTNFEVVSVLGTDSDGVPLLRQRTWERGAAITLACGTGASAVAVAAILSGRVKGPKVRIRLDGGNLDLSWAGLGHSVIKTGPAEYICEGVLL